jgi:hypothetical protein
MSAIAFQANPEKWTNDGTMRDYLENVDQYVYWSTPENEVSPRQVQVGMPALIVRTAGRFGLRAIIAVGNVEEVPRQYRRGGEGDFAFPQRLSAPGDEDAASSDWKTGIRLSGVRWERGTPAERLWTIQRWLATGERGRTAFLLDDDDATNRSDLGKSVGGRWLQGRRRRLRCRSSRSYRRPALAAYGPSRRE